jgi:hypothetical protein
LGEILQQVPQKFQTIAALQMVAGICNVFFGWYLGWALWSVAGAVCTGILTLGICPFGLLCGFCSWLIIPIGLIEVTVGILMLASPQAVRGFIPWLPLLQFPALLLGDFISPIIGSVSLFLCRDPDVTGYIARL